MCEEKVTVLVVFTLGKVVGSHMARLLVPTCHISFSMLQEENNM